MSKREIEPLEPGMWFTEIERLHARRAAPGGSPSVMFRKAFYLVQLAPRPLEPFLPADLQEATIERLLECGSYSEAALALFDAPIGLTLNRDPESSVTRAKIKIPGATGEGSDVDETPAMAMLGAWCRAFMLLKDPLVNADLLAFHNDPAKPAPNSDSSVH